MTEALPEKGKGNGKARLIQAASMLAQKSVFDDITIDEIVKAADLSRPAFYYHFAGGKEELRSELVRCGFMSETPTQDTRQAILEAALRVFARSGTSAATIDDIAAEAGVSRGALCWHYHSKDKLLTAVIEHNPPFTAFRSAIKALEQALQQGIPLDDETILRNIAGGFYDAFTTQSDLTRLSILLVHTRPEFTTMIAQRIGNGRKIIAKYISKRQEQGIFRKDIDAALFVQIIAMSFCMRAIGLNDHLPFAHLSREEVINQIVSTLLYGIVERN